MGIPNFPLGLLVTVWSTAKGNENGHDRVFGRISAHDDPFCHFLRGSFGHVLPMDADATVSLPCLASGPWPIEETSAQKLECLIL